MSDNSAANFAAHPRHNILFPCETAPTCEQLSNEELPLADRKVDDSWRHGVRVTAVYRRDVFLKEIDVAIADIRKHRGVPAQRGMRIFSRHSNRWGTIVSSTSGYLKIRLDGDKHAACYHPTWKLDYYDKTGTIIFRSPQE